jgi:hypothetical protein
VTSENDLVAHGGVTAPADESPPVSETDLRFVEHQIAVHVDLTQWKPDAHVQEAKPACWRRAFAIAHLRRDGVTETAALAHRLGASEDEVDKDRRLIPYLDRTIAGLLSVLGWYVDTAF